MLTNRSDLIKQKNKNLSVQINELSNTFPHEIRPFYQKFLNKNERANPLIIQEEINSVINYEIVFLALQKRE